jgi:hypothetical protein
MQIAFSNVGDICHWYASVGINIFRQLCTERPCLYTIWAATMFSKRIEFPALWNLADFGLPKSAMSPGDATREKLLHQGRLESPRRRKLGFSYGNGLICHIQPLCDCLLLNWVGRQAAAELPEMPSRYRVESRALCGSA